MGVFISKSRSGPTIHSYESERNRCLNVSLLLCTFCVSFELEIKLKEEERKLLHSFAFRNFLREHLKREKKNGNDGYFYLFYDDDAHFRECKTFTVGGKLISKDRI